jgi:hypothetical protein
MGLFCEQSFASSWLCDFSDASYKGRLLAETAATPFSIDFSGD